MKPQKREQTERIEKMLGWLLERVEHIEERLASPTAPGERRPLPDEPGSVITWRDGAYLPQIAQLDAGHMSLGWRVHDDDGGIWAKSKELQERHIGNARWTLLAPAPGESL